MEEHVSYKTIQLQEIETRKLLDTGSSIEGEAGTPFEYMIMLSLLHGITKLEQ